MSAFVIRIFLLSDQEKLLNYFYSGDSIFILAKVGSGLSETCKYGNC